jgi:Pectate lyase superfamily protein
VTSFDAGADRGDVKLFATTVVVCLALLCACSRPATNPMPSPTPDPAPTELNVKDFGAKGNGVTDDRPFLQAALDSAYARGLGVYFPAGIYLLRTATQSRDRILRTYPQQRLRGDGSQNSVLRVGNNYGDYVTVIGTADDSVAVGDWSMRSMRVDQNASGGNLLTPGKVATSPRMSVRLGSYAARSLITVEDCGFVNSDSVNVLYLYAGAIGVRRNLFVGTGGIRQTPPHDHSTVYTTVTVAGGSQDISANAFRGVRASGGARTAIETHGGRQVIHGNRIADYLQGANLTGIAPVPTGPVDATGNTIAGAMVGFQLWAAARRGQSDVLHDVTVATNQITLDPVVWAHLRIDVPTSAILLNADNTVPVDRLTVHANTFQYADHGAAVARYAAVVECQVHNPAARPRGIRITANTIVRPPGAAISPACQGSDAQIQDNRVIN